MTIYWITFRISEETVGGKTYEERYKALIETIKKFTDKWWAEPTSFIAFSGNQGIDSIAAACKTAIAPTHDLFLIREMDAQSARICGKNDDKDIFEFMPYLKKV